MTPALLLAIAAAMMLVRIGWGGVRGAAAGGWTLALAALAVLLVRDGVWGVAMGTAAGMAAALLIVLQAGWTSPARLMRPPRVAAAVTLPRAPLDLLQRLAVFVLVVPVAFAAAEWLAFGLQAIARRGGMVEADATVLMLMIQPVLWTGLIAVQMTRAGPARMIAPPAVAALLGTLAWWAA